MRNKVSEASAMRNKTSQKCYKRNRGWVYKRGGGVINRNRKRDKQFQRGK